MNMIFNRATVTGNATVASSKDSKYMIFNRATVTGNANVAGSKDLNVHSYKVQ